MHRRQKYRVLRRTSKFSRWKRASRTWDEPNKRSSRGDHAAVCQQPQHFMSYLCAEALSPYKAGPSLERRQGCHALPSRDSSSSAPMLNSSSSNIQRKPTRALHEYTWKEWRNVTLLLLFILSFLVAFLVPVITLGSGTRALLWDLRGHLPFFSFSAEQWYYGPSGADALWLAVATSAFLLGSFYLGVNWLLWSGFQYGFRTSAITSTPLDPKYGAFKPLPRLACPAETPVRRQEIRCLIAFITGFLAYAWFIVACVIGFHWCAAARATHTPASNLSMSRLLWWRQAFPEHWPPNILLEVLCLYVLSITLIWSGQRAGRAAALTPAQKQP